MIVYAVVARRRVGLASWREVYNSRPSSGAGGDSSGSGLLGSRLPPLSETALGGCLGACGGVSFRFLLRHRARGVMRNRRAAGLPSPPGEVRPETRAAPASDVCR